MSQPSNWGMQSAAPASPTAVAGRVNGSLNALLTGHSGASRPSYAVAGTVWQDDSTPTLIRSYFYDGTDDILLCEIDVTNNRVTRPLQPWVELSAATSMNIAASTSQNIRVSGTGVSISSLGSASDGVERTLLFLGSNTLMNNGTSLILLGGANIFTAAGDIAKFISDEDGNWRCVGYEIAASTPISAFLRGSAAIATTSGTQVDSLADIPSWAQRVVILLAGVSTNGPAGLALQLGDSGGLEASAYSSGGAFVSGTNTAGIFSAAGSFTLVSASAAASLYSGRCVLEKIDGNTWHCSSSISSNSGVTFNQNGTKTLSGALDRFALLSGGNTFDAGTMKYYWE